MSQMRYLGVKTINAIPMNRADYNTLRGWELPSDENGSDEGYLVEYIGPGQKPNTPHFEGHVSWSPKDVFEASYRPIDSLTFGQAIEALKLGKKVRREGWNGKGMWLVFMPPFRVEEPNDRTQAHGITQPFDCGGYVVMWTAQGVWQPGWLASQADMLAEDWQIVE